MRPILALGCAALLGTLSLAAGSPKERGTRLDWEPEFKSAWEKAALRNVPLLVVFSADG